MQEHKSGTIVGYGPVLMHINRRNAIAPGFSLYLAGILIFVREKKNRKAGHPTGFHSTRIAKPHATSRCRQIRLLSPQQVSSCRQILPLRTM
jgi:hypothetical protein